MTSRVGEAEQGQEDAIYDSVNLHVNLATKEDIIRHYRIQLAKLEVRLAHRTMRAFMLTGLLIVAHVVYVARAHTRTHAPHRPPI